MEEGCSSSWGNPSGHALEAINIPLLLLLDNIFPSDWSKKKYPALNTKTLNENRGAFAANLVFLLYLCPSVTFARLFLGKHTLNQLLLGNQLGIWQALFFHFCLRDLIFNHITSISSRNMNGKEFIAYGGTAAAVIAPLFGIMSIYMYILGATIAIPQDWLQNLSTECPNKVEFE